MPPLSRAFNLDMRALLFALALTAATPPADACSINGTPAAYVLSGTNAQPPGHQPFFALFRVEGAVKMTKVDPKCAAKTICKGTDVPFERSANVIRPKQPLPDGARIQVTGGTKLLGDVTVVTGAGLTLPTDWGKITKTSAGMVKEGLCSPEGPQVMLGLKPAGKTDGTFLLVYLAKPDDKNPFTNLSTIYNLGSSMNELGVQNHLGEEPWMKSVPKQLWVRVADGEGHVGPTIAL